MDSRTSVQPHFEHLFGKPTSDGRRELARCYHVTVDWRAGGALLKLARSLFPQTVYEQRAACRYGHVLLAAHGIAHRTGDHRAP